MPNHQPRTIARRHQEQPLDRHEHGQPDP
jgi:hypothetical protein